MHDARLSLSLDYEKLSRFAEMLKTPFRKALRSSQVDLLPAPEEGKEQASSLCRRAGAERKAVFEGQTLIVPLLGSGRVIALIEARGVRCDQLPREVHPFLASLAETAVETVRLRWAAEIDPLSGLGNKYALRETVIAVISRRLAEERRAEKSGGREGEDLVLLGLRPAGLELLLEQHGRELEQWAWKELGRLCREAARPCLGLFRLENSLWFLLSGGKAQASRLKDTIQNKLTCLQFRQFPPLPLPWRAGAAVYSPQQAAHPSEAASWLISKAGRTLNAAWDLDDGNLLFFDELGDKAGRVKEVVSFNRLLINLGHLHGLKENAAFVVMDKDKEKAEISVPRPGGENSLAEVGNLYEPALIIKPGDQLRPLKPEDSWQAGRPGHSATLRLAGREVAVSLDETTPLLNHHSFMTAFRQLTENGEEGARELIPPLAAVLVKVADLGNLRQIAGRPGVDHVFRVLAEKAHAFNSGRDSGIVCARYAPDTVALLLPGYDRDKALNHARDLMGELVPLSERPLRAGVSYYPCLDFAPGQLLDNAAKSLTHAEFMEPGSVVACDAVSLNIYADSLFSEGLLAEAAAEYERALRLNPGELNVLNSLGVCYARLNRAGQAHAMFRRAQQTAPDDYMAYYNEAYDLMARDREGWPEAERLLRHCLSLQPGHPDVLFQLGRVAQNQGQFNQALDYYQQAQASPRCPGGVYRYLGEVLSLSAKLREAEEAFKKAVKFNSADAISLNHLASLYLQRGANLEIALSLAKRAWELDPERPRVWQVYAYALDKLGRSEQARALLQHGLRRYPDDPAQKLLLAQIQIRAGQLAEARDNLRQVLALEPNMKEALEALASLPGE